MDFFQSARFRERALQLMNEHRVPGLSIALAHGDKSASLAFGFACVSASKPCTPDALFDIASSSKILTAASVALLVEDEAYPDVKFDTAMRRLLPDDFVMSGSGYTENVTVEDILSHRTGLAGHDVTYMGIHSAEPDTARSITRNLRNLPVAAPIRAKYIYNNAMFIVATHLIETKAGVPFPEFLETRFFKPLHMTSSNLQPARARERGLGERIATGHMWHEEEHRYHEFMAPDKPERQGAGSIVTSAEDYIKWVKALMRREAPATEGVYRGVTAIRSVANPAQEDLEPMTSPVFYCAGLEVRYYRGHAIFGHYGVAEGYGSRFFFIPSLDFCGVMLGNGPNTSVATNILVRELTDSVLGVDSLPVSIPVKETRHEPSEPQEKPLEAYVGRYWNKGYRDLEVEIRDSALCIDANKRSFPREIRLRHLSSQTHYMAHIGAGQAVGGMPDMEQVRAEFVFENDRAVKLGIAFAEGLDELIWFSRVPDAEL